MTLYDVDRRLVRGRYQVGVDTVTVDAMTPDHASELALEVDHGMGPHIAVTCKNIRPAPIPQAIIDEYCPTGSSAKLEGEDWQFAPMGEPATPYDPDTQMAMLKAAMAPGPVIDQPKRRPGRPRKAA